MLKVHRDIILSNLSVLVDETDLNKLVPELLKRGVFNERMINRILNPSFNPKRQKTDLYIDILKRGPQAFAELQGALFSTNHLYLARILSEMDHYQQSQMYRSPSLNSVGSSSTDYGEESDGPCQSTLRKRSPSDVTKNTERIPLPQDLLAGTSDVGDVQMQGLSNPKNKVFNPPAYRIEIIRDDVLRASDAVCPEGTIVYRSEKFLPVIVKKALHWQFQTGERPQLYKMDSNPRGYSLVINNNRFNDAIEFPERKGSENDAIRLTQLLKQFHFEVEFHEDKTKGEMEEIVRKFSKKKELWYVDCIWVTIMSHGQEGTSLEDSEIVGTDGLGYKEYDIISNFFNDACEALINKPKMFFLQACRGQLTDPGVIVGNLSQSLSKRITVDGKQIGPLPNRKIRTRSDIFVAYPTPAGIMANRDLITGAWFIQTVVDVFSRHACELHLEDLLKKVDDEIKRKNNLINSNFQAVTTKSIGWCKHLYFHPGLSRDPTTGATVKMGCNIEPSPEADEGMDVVDTKENAGKCPNGTTYSRLKDDKDEDSEEENKKNGCLNMFSCKMS